MSLYSHCRQLKYAPVTEPETDSSLRTKEHSVIGGGEYFHKQKYATFLGSIQ